MPGNKTAPKVRGRVRKEILDSLIIDDVLDWFDVQPLHIRKALWILVKQDFEGAPAPADDFALRLVRPPD
jgi:hypothetical protein